MDKDIAISVKNVSKTFRIPHEKVTSVRGAVVSAFKSGGYEEFQALDDVSFDVKRGEFFGIIGRNGSGKSTLLKILAGIYQPDSGKIKINGMISPFLELGIGFNPELSGRDNVYLNATVLGMTKKQIDEKFDSIVKFSELERFIDQKLKNYSSGMSVRLAFSVAIHANRDILLMDEVLAVGDMNFQNKCLGKFKDLKKEGKTIILVSHDMQAMKDFSDRALVLNQGKVVIIDDPEKTSYEYSRIMVSKNKNGIDKKRNDDKIKSGNYYIDVRLLDANDDERSVFRSGDDIVVEIEVNIDSLDENMFISASIVDEMSGVSVCGNNMFFENVTNKWVKGLNKIRLVFKNIPLHKGDFYILSSFFKGDPKNNEIYDFYNGKEKSNFLKIIPNSRHQGIIYMPHEWKV